MNHLSDIEDFSDLQLILELYRRGRRYAKGLCPYCNRPRASTAPCHYPERHAREPSRDVVLVGGPRDGQKVASGIVGLSVIEVQKVVDPKDYRDFESSLLKPPAVDYSTDRYYLHKYVDISGRNAMCYLHESIYER